MMSLCGGWNSRMWDSMSLALWWKLHPREKEGWSLLQGGSGRDEGTWGQGHSYPCCHWDSSSSLFFAWLVTHGLVCFLLYDEVPEAVQLIKGEVHLLSHYGSSDNYSGEDFSGCVTAWWMTSWEHMGRRDHVEGQGTRDGSHENYNNPKNKMLSEPVSSQEIPALRSLYWVLRFHKWAFRGTNYTPTVTDCMVNDSIFSYILNESMSNL